MQVVRQHGNFSFKTSGISGKWATTPRSRTDVGMGGGRELSTGPLPDAVTVWVPEVSGMAGMGPQWVPEWEASPVRPECCLGTSYPKWRRVRP